MPNWTEHTSENTATYLKLLRSSAAVYAETQPEELELLLGKRPGRAFVYQDDERDFYFLLLMTPSPSNPDILKMVHAIPGGNFDPAETVRIVITKIRQLLDEIGITRYYGRPAKNYENPRINEFFEAVAKMVWEVTEIEDDPTKEFYTYHFHRDPTRKNEDELFTR